MVLSADFTDANLCISYTCTNHYLAKRFERCSLELLLCVKPFSLVFYPINSNHHFTEFCLFLTNLARPLDSGFPSLYWILETPPGSKLGDYRAHLSCFLLLRVDSSSFSAVLYLKTAVSQFIFLHWCYQTHSSKIQICVVIQLLKSFDKWPVALKIKFRLLHLACKTCNSQGSFGSK